MAEALVSTVLNQFASILKSRIEQEASLVVGVDKEVKKLCNNLSAIQAVLADAEKRQVKEAAVRDWLDKLKDVSYDIDDVLDEWNTAIHKMQMEGDEHGPASQRQVRSFFHFPCFRCGPLVSRRDIALKIKDLNGRLDDIAKGKDRYNFVPVTAGQVGGPMIPSVMERAMTTSFIDKTEVKGREQDKREIINMLLSESSETPSLRIISLVGMGGIGKTTLAKLVYNEHEVKTYFEERIWVCVSDPFDEIRVAKAILESLTLAASNLVELQTILQRIQQSFQGKRFLLVLDDVWTEDSRKWEQLRNSLICGSRGSRVLVTTRKENVATIMGCTNSDIFRLGQLSMQQCWSIFSQSALFGRSSGECKRLEGTGKKIVKKCKGLPLAVKTIGGLLRFRESRKEWESVLNSELWELEEVERDVLAPLLLSFYDLPVALRPCFTYCATFPKDWEIEKDKLIKLWMAQGYLRGTKNKDMEIIGEGYFQNLAMRSFFQDFGKNRFGVIICKMHDMVHDLAQFVSRNQCFSLEVNSVEGPSLESIYKGGLHSLIMLKNEALFPDSIQGVKKLRSLLVDCNGYLNYSCRAILPNLLNQLSCLRSLDLSNCDIVEIPSSISKLTHLRWLDLSVNTGLKELPELLCELFNLQTLAISLCTGLVKLPHGMGKLVNLRHLHNLAVNALLPKGIRRLSSLRTLERYKVSDDEEAACFGDLKNLNHLQGIFQIDGLGNVTNVGEAKQAQLKLKKGITSLGLDFGGKDEEGEWRKHHDEELIEALEPSPSLEELKIRLYKGTALFPSWVMTSLTQLRKVDILDCRNCKQLPPLGKLPSLEFLTIHRMQGVTKVGVEFLGIKLETQSNYKSDIHHHQISSSSSSAGVVAFPKLTTLQFHAMENWEEWDDENDDGMMMRNMTNGNKEVDDGTNMKITIMPCLHSLMIWGCPKLNALPHQLLQHTKLQQLKISSCLNLRQRYGKETGQDWPKISHIPYIHIF